MLLRFGVSNHLSIRDYRELLLSASSLKDPDEGLIACAAAPAGSVVPAAVIYGANASGKSNFVNALATMRAMVLYSHARGTPDSGVPRRPFALDPACADSPSQFDIDFVLDGARYHYGFEASDKAFESEWLYVYPKSHRRLLFEREGGDFHFGRALKGRNNVIKSLTRGNSLYLSAAAQSGHESLSKVYAYFESIRGDRNISVPGFSAPGTLATEVPDGRVIDFLERMGAGIVGWRRKNIDFPENAMEFHAEIARIFRKWDPGFKMDFAPAAFELAHKGRKGEKTYFQLDWESAGTRRLLVLLNSVYRALDDGAPLVVDELDASLHTQSMEGLLQLFSSPEANPKSAQIVATTHDTNLMNSPILRRDQVWFAEKSDGGATRLYPLTDIRTRKGDNIERGYLQGRYGATPRNLGIVTVTSLR